MERNQFLTPDQLVDRWSKAVGRGTLANWRAQGKGPTFTKLGSRVVYSLSDVIEYEQTNATGVTADQAVK